MKTDIQKNMMNEPFGIIPVFEIWLRADGSVTEERVPSIAAERSSKPLMKENLPEAAKEFARNWLGTFIDDPGFVGLFRETEDLWMPNGDPKKFLGYRLLITVDLMVRKLTHDGKTQLAEGIFEQEQFFGRILRGGTKLN